MTRWVAAGVIAAIAAGVALGCRPGGLPAAAGPSRVEVLQTPNGGIQPQAVTDAGGTLHLLYFNGEAGAGDLFYQRRAPGQSGWSEPGRVNGVPGSAVATGTIRGGQLAL